MRHLASYGFPIVLALAASGCLHIRRAAAVVDVPGPICSVATRNRYQVIWRLGQHASNKTRLLKLFQSRVFADDGIPVTVTIVDSRSDSFGLSNEAKIAQFVFYLCSCGIAPFFNNFETHEMAAISIPYVAAEQSRNVSVATKRDAMWAILPIPACMYVGEASFPHSNPDAKSLFVDHHYGMNSGVAVWGYDANDWAYQAWAYGLASRLKELEDAGVINDEIAAKHAADRKKAEAARQFAAEKKKHEQRISRTLHRPSGAGAARPPYRVLRIERDANCSFAYNFALELNGEPSIQTFFGVQNVFEDEMRSSYLLEYPNAEASSLRIAVHPRLTDGRIEGRAEVLTIAPLKLSYDSHTRLGKLAVRFSDGQADEARAWIRKHIETLARDKNIALVTGQLPPAATYYSLGEKVDGNVMEIEFKTE